MLISRSIVAGSRRVIQARSRTCSTQTSSVTPSPPKPESKPPPDARTLHLKEHRASNFDKWMLAHFKKYPKGEVPDYVTQNLMEKTRSQFKIKINFYMFVAALVSIAYWVYQGKKERAAGYSVAKMNMEWHAEINRKHREEMETKEGR